jgi:hypothetical protein
VRDRDVDKIVAPYADDILAFDAIQALQFKGKAAGALGNVHGFVHRPHGVRSGATDRARRWRPGPGPLAQPLRAFDDESQCGFMHGGVSSPAGQWQVIHEHWSAPFDMETQKALFDLKP